jgi:hypothetical protein
MVSVSIYGMPHLSGILLLGHENVLNKIGGIHTLQGMAYKMKEFIIDLVH